MKYTNRLSTQNSPYLLQHANNPVNWFPWGEEAFLIAKKENKPIFLSIGYSSCHWCHVMENESFMDLEVAAILNENFISIKVDKEERPDIDNIYMQVCQGLTQSGGWPLSVFITSEQKPFFAGTYFPKTTKFRHIGFIDLLNKVIELWNTDQKTLIDQANHIINTIFSNEHKIDRQVDPIEQTYNYLNNHYDPQYGGFSTMPKFPTPHNILFLLNYHQYLDQSPSLQMSEKTLISMYKGGIFDHIGYGFCRYSTDSIWLVPHFEKMLYDNALLLIAYSECYQITKKEIYKKIAEKIIIFLTRDFKGEHQAFYTAYDADSDHEEGKFYLFTPQEITSVLGEMEGSKFNDFFNITSSGNFEGRNICSLIHQKNLDMDIKTNEIYEYRKKRDHLFLDDKVLTSWNSLTIYALARASAIFNNNETLVLAINCFNFIKNKLLSDDNLFSSYRNNKISEYGFLDDYASFIFACIGLYKTTLKADYLDLALKLNDAVYQRFYDEKDGGFFLNDINNTSLFLRAKETYDGAIPSSNSLMAYNLFYLANYTSDEILITKMNDHFAFMKKEASRYSGGYSFFANVLLQYEFHSKITCALQTGDTIDNYLDKLKSYDIVIILNENNQYPLINNQTTFYICKNNQCYQGVNQL